jgi:hypothetical protein
MTNNNETFVRITNQDIFSEIKDLHRKIDTMSANITHRQDVANGKVKKGLWIATTAMSLTIILLGFLIEHILRTK